MEVTSVVLAVALSLNIGAVPHRELPSSFVADRVFVMPRIADSGRRLALWVDTDGSGFLRSSVVSQLHLETTAPHWAYLPSFAETAFPPPKNNRGALQILDDADVAGDPIFSGVDGQLGWTWLSGRIWTIDYVGRHLYQDYSVPPIPGRDRVPLLFDIDHRYPQLEIAIEGKTYRAALDTAASVAVTDVLPSGMRGSVRVHATSFVPLATLQAWHVAHPAWPYNSNYGVGSGILMIRVPEVTAGAMTFHNVWFSTRPNDDVFKGDSVDVKLGPTAFANCAVTLDYVDEFAGFECSP